MKTRNNQLKLTTALVFLGIFSVSAAGQKPPSEPRDPQSGLPGGRPATNVLAVEKINHQQFRSLQGNAQVAYKGQKMTKADFVALKLKEWGASQACTTNERGRPTSSQTLESRKADFERRRTTELMAQSAKAQTDFEKMLQDESRLTQSPQYSALAREASDLANRWTKATAAEKTRIQQRAAEVYKQLVQMEETPVRAE